MSRSHNDIKFLGGILRKKETVTRDGSHQARFFLIDPSTGEPYSYSGILNTLEQLKKEYPNYRDIIEELIKNLRHKERRRHGANIFSYFASSNDEKVFEEKCSAIIKHRLEPLAQILYRPQCLANIKSGNFTIEQFVSYLDDAMYVSVSPKSASDHVKTAMKTKILPTIGSDRIEVYMNSVRAKDAALEKIAKLLDDMQRKENVRQYTNRALRLLFSALREYGVSLKGNNYLPRHYFDSGAKKNYDVAKQLSANHLGDDERERFFAFLAKDSKYLAELLWTGLIYSGLTRNEIGALRYTDFKSYNIVQGEQLTGESVYTCVVTKALKKSSDTHWRTVDISSKEFPFSKIRRIVLIPWLTGILHRMIMALRAAEIDDNDMLLSMGSDGKINTPDEIGVRISTAMRESSIFKLQKIPRQQKDKTVITTHSANFKLLEFDARYVARKICHMPTVMFHSTFGLSATMTDEQDYLDSLSDAFALCRHFYLRRFYPKVFLSQVTAPSKEGVLAILPSIIPITVSGDSDNEKVLSIETDLGVDISWQAE